MSNLHGSKTVLGFSSSPQLPKLDGLHHAAPSSALSFTLPSCSKPQNDSGANDHCARKHKEYFQTTGLSSFESPRGFSSSEQQNTTSSHQLHHPNHTHTSPPLPKSNDLPLSPSLHRSTHSMTAAVSIDADKRTLFPILPVPIVEGGEMVGAITSPHANSNTALATAHTTVRSPSISIVQSNNHRPILSPTSRKAASSISNSIINGTHHNDFSPVSRRDSLPMGLRNKKMQATDCLLFAATLLEQDASASTTASVNSRVGSGIGMSGAGITDVFAGQALHESISEVSPPLVHSFGVRTVSSSLSSTADTDMAETSPRSIGAGAIQLANRTENVEKESSINYSDPQETTAIDTPLVVDEPQAVDVLCGRGGKVNKHPGNIIFRKVVAFNKSYYQSVHKRNRILVSQSIVQAITNHGGRFLINSSKGKKKKDVIYWEPIDFKKAVQKTSQALREFKKDDEDCGKDG